VPIPDHVYRFWRALDGLFSDVMATSWGAVVTDGRFPRIWDANYARVDVADRRLRATDIERDLLPALTRVGAETMHVVTFHHEQHTALLAELSSRGHRLGWDLVMDAAPRVAHDPSGPTVEKLAPDEELWGSVGDSLALFGADPGEAIEQLRVIERDVLAPGGKRWFGIRDDRGTIVSLAALLLLEGVAYVDNVATFPEHRGRGYASAVTRRLMGVAAEADATRVCLLTDPDDTAVVMMYERLGFAAVGRLASTRGPMPI
jgi:ribosomal protein S18 acetylase RimI-like enzyme